MLDRIHAIIARHGTDPAGDPHTYTHGTRMLLEQLDAYPVGTPCRVISVKELQDISREIAFLRDLPDIPPPVYKDVEDGCEEDRIAR